MITKFNYKDRTIRSYAIRKLTPLECFRLMGIRDAVIHIMQSTVEKAKQRVKGLLIKGKPNDMAISASQQYKQAANSIIVDVLTALYSQLWYPKPNNKPRQMSIMEMLDPSLTLPNMPKASEAGGQGCKHILTTFSGYDSQLMAADALKEKHPDFEWDCVGWSDIDKYACQMHDLVFPQYADKALGDITKIDWFWLKYALLHNLTYKEVISEEWRGKNVYTLSAEEYNAMYDEVAKADCSIDLFTYSSPCQDISQAGKQMGLKEGSGSRSALLWHVADAVEILRPKYLLQENVAALVSEKFMGDFQLWLNRLESLGYVNKWALINGKDQNVPQNRLRVFCLSMRKDVAFDYQFPDPVPLTRTLEDVLENDVEEKYFLKDEAVSKFLKANDKDSAVFVQYSMPPTHENAMFLKTWLQCLMEYKNGWELKPTELESLVKQSSEVFPYALENREPWLNIVGFRTLYDYNVRRTKNDPNQTPEKTTVAAFVDMLNKAS